MKLKFWLLTGLLLFSRGCDFYSTSLWFFQPDGMKGEMNPLTYFFGVGWNGLILANVIVISLILHAFYQYSYHKTKPQFTTRPKDYMDYGSLLYFNQSGQLYKLMYQCPKNHSVAWQHFGYIVVRVVIILSFLAPAHNLLQYYNVATYDLVLDAIHLVMRPLLLMALFGIALLVYFQIRILKKEFAKLPPQ
ncbi:MAG: hypothetical protein JNL70_15130 [Saprospiraceae bacterium]|nr:hypothetical protein [Saprospiraceae bacterium]